MADTFDLADELATAFDENIINLQSRNGNSTFSADYLLKHRARFVKTAELIPQGNLSSVALEIGATDFFQSSLENFFHYGKVLGTIFSATSEKRFIHQYWFNGNSFSRLAFNVNLESEMIPLEDDSVDFILCAEVIEHFDIDPMFALIEFNRILKKGGKLLITTPNSCSARNLHKMVNGYRPHFFMQYEISRSPYRHNFEYDIHALNLVVRSAGFKVDILETDDVFEPRLEEAYDLIAKYKFDAAFRGDDIFLLATKSGSCVDRWPSGMYF